MNWRIGLFRVWVVASLVWIGAIGTLGFYEWYTDPPRIVDVRPIAKGEPDFARAAAELHGHTIEPESPWRYAPMAMVPPLITLLIGVGAFWSVAGFRARL